MRRTILVLSLVVSIGFLGCGDDDDDPTPPVATPVDPTPGPVNPRGPEWIGVFNERFTDMITEDQCDVPFIFEVDDSGDFRAGPCTSGGSDVKNGTLNAVELVRLDRLASAVANNDLRTRSCDDGSAIAGSSTDLALSNNRTREVYRNHPDELCFRGDKEEAQELHEFVSGLSEKYYPSRPPQPTPSPTPVATRRD